MIIPCLASYLVPHHQQLEKQEKNMERIYEFLPSIIMLICIAVVALFCSALVPRSRCYVSVIGDEEEQSQPELGIIHLVWAAPAVEELIFRAPLIIAWSAMSTNAWYGIFVSTILFALAHLPMVKKRIMIIGVIPLGILTGYYGILYQSIWVSVGIHMLWNSLRYALDLLKRRGR